MVEAEKHLYSDSLSRIKSWLRNVQRKNMQRSLIELIEFTTYVSPEFQQWVDKLPHVTQDQSKLFISLELLHSILKAYGLAHKYFFCFVEQKAGISLRVNCHSAIITRSLNKDKRRPYGMINELLSLL